MRDWRAEVRRRLEGARLDGGTERDVVDELAQHLEDRFHELRGRGVPAEEAELQALAELDGDGALAERLRSTVATRREPLAVGRPLEPLPAGGAIRELVHGWWSDLRFGARSLARSPLYAAIAIVVIGLGIGGNTILFTALNTVLLRPPPGVADPEQLAAVFTSDYSGPRFSASSYPDYEDIRDAGVFDGVSAHTIAMVSLTGEDWTWRGMVEVVSGNYFEVLGVSPAAGRFFTADESDPERLTSVIVIGYDLWEMHYGRAPDAIGSTVRVRGQPFTVIGVAPPDFNGSFLRGLRMQAWLPVSAPRTATDLDASNRGNRGMSITGRMPADASVETVQERLDAIATRQRDAYPELWTDVNDRGRVLTALPESEARVPPSGRTPILGMTALLMGALFTVLLIACSNVANLMLTRASTRRAEMSLRLALGASRGRIVRHLLAESLVLAGLGGAAGFLLAWTTANVLSSSLPVLDIPVPVSLDLAIDARVLAFTALITLLTGLLFGLAPALQTSRTVAPTIKEGSSAGVRLRVRNALVIFQVASSLVLLVAGGLFIRSLSAARGMESGFQIDDVVVARVDLGPEGYTDEEAIAFQEELLTRAAGLPGANAIALAESVPLGLGWSRGSISVEGYEPEPGEDMEFMNNLVTPGYFDAMGIEPVLGRVFTSADVLDAPSVVVVSEAFARRFWPGENPLGKRVERGGAAEVVGVVPDAKYRSLVEEPQPYFYFPYLQRPAPHAALLVRSTADGVLVTDAVLNLVRSMDAALPPARAQTFRQHMDAAAVPQRIAAGLLSALGLFAIAIAAIGLYGLVAFGVTQRSREFGIRIALGAASTDVRGLVLRGALRLVVIGIVCGVPVAAAVALLVRSFLVVQPIDPVAFICVPLLLTGCALLAAYAPARRATRQDPAAALRSE
jgi:predicted permease